MHGNEGNTQTTSLAMQTLPADGFCRLHQSQTIVLSVFVAAYTVEKQSVRAHTHKNGWRSEQCCTGKMLGMEQWHLLHGTIITICSDTHARSIQNRGILRIKRLCEFVITHTHTHTSLNGEIQLNTFHYYRVHGVRTDGERCCDERTMSSTVCTENVRLSCGKKSQKVCCTLLSLKPSSSSHVDGLVSTMLRQSCHIYLCLLYSCKSRRKIASWQLRQQQRRLRRQSNTKRRPTSSKSPSRSSHPCQYVVGWGGYNGRRNEQTISNGP